MPYKYEVHHEHGGQIEMGIVLWWRKSSGSRSLREIATQVLARLHSVEPFQGKNEQPILTPGCYPGLSY